MIANIILIILAAISVAFLVVLATSKIFERYFLFETIKPFFLCLFVITFIMMLDRIIDLMNTIIEKDLDIITIINLFTLSLPFIVALSVPMAVLTSTIMAFGRMSVDKELTAAKSTGVNIYKLTRLLALFFLIIAVGMAYFNDFILPETNHVLKNLLVKVAYKKPITAIKPGTFTTINNMTIYTRDRDGEALYDLLIYNTEGKQYPQTIQAKKGELYIDQNTDQLKVVLYDGEMYERDTGNPQIYNITKFGKYTLVKSDLGYATDETGSDYRGNRELTSLQMRGLINDYTKDLHNINTEIDQYKTLIIEIGDYSALRESNPAEYQRKADDFRKYTVLNSTRIAQKADLEKQIRIYYVEIHKKYSLAITCFIFMLVGLPIGMMTKTSGIGVSFIFSSIIFLVFYFLLIFGEEFATKNILNPAFAMWLPPIIFSILGTVLIYFSSKEKSFDVMVPWNATVKFFARFIRRRQRQASPTV